MFKRTKKIINGLYHHWLTVAFFLGFITDFLLLNKVDDLFDNLILLFYVLLATFSMMMLYVGVAERVPEGLAKFLKKYAPILMQYSFGGLLSGMLIFYGRSGDLIASAPFLLLIITVIFGNEFVSKRSDRLVYHIALYFTGVFSYMVMVVPILLGKMGDGIFILSGLIAVLVVTFVVQILYRIIPNYLHTNVHLVIVTVGFIYIGFNILYFTSLIPPIPLSLNQLEITQSVERLSSGNYRVVSEAQPWYRKIPFARDVIHPINDSIACFSKVYAPTKIETDIYHRWEYKDENGQWQEQFRLGYPISGVAKQGYRGYTRLQSFSDGVWRCSVETERGQVLGRKTILINTVEETRQLMTQIK